MLESLCRISRQPFVVSDREVAFCNRMQFPLPTLSPSERFRALMAFRNEWMLYRRKCDATGEEIISAYPTNSPFPVYKNEFWWGDSWDATQYGRDFDFGRPFFEQFAELQKVVPREGTTIFNSENCDFNSHWRRSKNCYLNSLGAECEDVYYSYWLIKSKDVFDSLYTNESTLCYSCSDVNRCYHCVMLMESNDCTDCAFSYQLQGCENCMFSSNLVRKNYYLFNKPVSKERFLAFKQSIFNGSWATWQKAYKDFLNLMKNTVHRNVRMLKCENCTGDHVYNSKNCLNCYDTFDAEDCENCISACDSKDIYSSYSSGWQSCEIVYQSVVSRGSQNLAFCNYSWFSSDLRYCDSCISCQNCFGCIGLRHKQFCILNKQYSKEEYFVLLPKIIQHMTKTGEWGEFFPPSLSPFAYNETGAQDFFPLERAQAERLGYRWREGDTGSFLSSTFQNIPDLLSEVPDNIIHEVLVCSDCHKNYRIIPQELRFYKSFMLPVPRQCPSCRHKQRMSLRNPIHLWSRSCAQCGRIVDTSFSLEKNFKIYCQDCYRKEVY